MRRCALGLRRWRDIDAAHGVASLREGLRACGRQDNEVEPLARLISGAVNEAAFWLAEMDGAKAVSIFFYLTLPHLSRALTVVVLIETIFLLSIFAEILVTTNGGPGTASTNIAYLVYAQALLQFDVGGASAGGIVAVILANIVAFFLIRLIGKNLDN